MTSNCSQTTGVAQSKIQLNLSDRSLTWLHGAGMAGLWMTLKQLEEQFPTASQRPGQFDWALSSLGISLNWSGRDLDTLTWLLQQSFQTNREGLISLTGLHPQTLSFDTQVTIHQGITETFLQHNQFYQSTEKKRLELKIGKKTIVAQYKALTSYAHQGFAKHLCDEHGRLLQKSIQIAGWLYPGAAMSHAAFSKQTKFEVTPEEALALLFAPIACWYFMLPAEQPNKQTRYVLVIPEIHDLITYAECKWSIRDSSYDNFWVANSGDAGLKFLSLQEEARPAANHDIRQCQSVLFGKTKWASQQLVRTEVAIVEATEKTISCYQLSCKSFPNNIIYDSDKKSYVIASRIPGRIADNLAQDLPWWFHFDEETDVGQSSGKISFEKEALLKMIEETQWNDPAKKLFINACHEALRRIYAKLYDRTSDSEYVQIERRGIRIRSELGRCKNAITLRKFMSNFFSEAGQIPTLQNHWEDLLPIITGEVDWRLTRDLILLALASYKKSEAPKDAGNSKPKDLEEFTG